MLVASLAVIGCGGQQAPPPASGEAAPPAQNQAQQPSPAQDSAPAEPAQPTPVAPPVERSRISPPRADAPVKAVQPRSDTVAHGTAPAPPAPAPPAPLTPPAAPIVKTLPAGTPVDLIFLDGLSSETSQTGDPF